MCNRSGEYPYNNDEIKTSSDLARQLFIDRGLKYSDIKESDFYRLVSFVAKEIEKFSEDPENIYGIKTMKISKRLKRNMPEYNTLENGIMRNAFIKVSSHYFEGREAISFNADGFIGIAGWASDLNVKPFVYAFEYWLQTLEAKKEEQ